MIHQFIIDSTTTIESTDLEPQEELVINTLKRHKKLRIGQLVGALNSLGAHETFEFARKKTTIRKMYKIMRNLREAGCPIVGDSKGIWIARTSAEIEAFADHLEQKARSDIKSMLHLRRQMLSMVQSRTASLFDGLEFQEEEEI